MKHLFVSYNGEKTGFGWSRITIDLSEINDQELINIQDSLRKDSDDNTIVILNWKEWNYTNELNDGEKNNG